MANETVSAVRASFLDEMLQLHGCGRSLTVLTGDIEGLHKNPVTGTYDRLEPVLATVFEKGYHVLTFDINGVEFHSDDTLELLGEPKLERGGKPDPKPAGMDLLSRMFKTSGTQDPVSEEEASLQEIAQKVASTDYSPLHCLELLRHLADAVTRERSKPLCVLVRDASSLFPGENQSVRLTDQQAQRLQALLNWVRNPAFSQGRHIIVLMNPTASDLNGKLLNLQNAAHLQIPLPLSDAREDFLAVCERERGGLPLSMERKAFVGMTAGLRLAHIQDLLEMARQQGRTVAPADVHATINRSLKDLLGDIAKFKPADHTIGQVDSYDREKRFLIEVFEDCNDPATAVSVIGLFGPNGTGKTWLGEGVAASTGWAVLELTGLRSSDFGGTERLMEQLRLVLQPFSHIIIEVDEADTDLGDVRNNEHSHEVERRLYGKIVAMMSDRRYRGKVVWLLMTARPDKLGADVKSRCAAGIQLPIFDLEGEERKAFIRKQFERASIPISEDEAGLVLEKLKDASNRDLTEGLIPRYRSRKGRQPELALAQFLETWQPGIAIAGERKLQSLLAALHSSYPELEPQWIRELTPPQRAEKIDELKFELGIA